MATQHFGEGLQPSRTVLVVEDEVVNQQLLGKILGDQYICEYANNGKEAIRMLMKDSRRYSLILLDLFMPEMGGFEVLSVLKEDTALKRIPVIVLTSDKDAEVKSLQLGAVDFIPKPYDMPEVIRARVRRTIELSENKDIISATQSDSLTGLFTREFFMEYALLHDKSYPYVGMDAIVLNVNRFHLINEMHGRDFGDKVLQRVANKLRSISRKQHGVACRTGSDTFFLYVPHAVEPEKILDEVIDGISGMLDNPRVRFRMGVYPNVNRMLDMNRRFDCALLACNSIRSDYTKQIAMYDEDMHEKETYAERLINDVEMALKRHEFKVYYQPKFNIKGEDDILSSAEALIRWEHPELGMVRPDVFIPLFEENGLVQNLDRFVWREAAAQIKKWRDKYNITIPVSVNVSRIDMLEPHFVEEITNIVKDNGIAPGDYLLEVTESAYTESAEQIVAIVTELREIGFKVEMDDFGSGYSSLNMLSTLPIDVIKLDMGFIRNIHTSPKDFGMVELMMDIAEFLSVPVIAEGVEHQEQFDLLKKAGVDVIQGFYFSKPLPPEEFEHFIEEKIAKEKA